MGFPSCRCFRRKGPGPVGDIAFFSREGWIEAHLLWRSLEKRVRLHCIPTISKFSTCIWSIWTRPEEWGIFSDAFRALLTIWFQNLSMYFLFGRRRNNVFLNCSGRTRFYFSYSPHIPVLHPIISDFAPPNTIKACQKTQLFNRKHHPLPRPLGGGPLRRCQPPRRCRSSLSSSRPSGGWERKAIPFCRSWRNEKPKAGRRRTLKIQMQAGKGQIFWTVFWWVWRGWYFFTNMVILKGNLMMNHEFCWQTHLVDFEGEYSPVTYWKPTMCRSLSEQETMDSHIYMC